MQSDVLDFTLVDAASRERHSRHPRVDCRLAWWNKQGSDLRYLQLMIQRVFNIQGELTRVVRLRFPSRTQLRHDKFPGAAQFVA